MNKNYNYFKENANLEAVIINDPFELLKKKYGEKYTKYREDWKLAGQRKYLPDFPMHIDIDLIRKCNFNCIYCKEKNIGWTNDKLEIAQLTKILDECRNYKFYSINIGFNCEPFVENASKKYYTRRTKCENNIRILFLKIINRYINLKRCIKIVKTRGI